MKCWKGYQIGAKLGMITPNPFKISAYAIDTSMPGRHEQLYGDPVAITNVHVGTKLVYTGPNEDWFFGYAPLPAFEPNTRLWVTQIDSTNKYKLENGDKSVEYWIGARQMIRFLRNGVLCIAPSDKLDALRRGPSVLKVRACAIDTAVLSGCEEQLHGQPQAVTNVHRGTELVYVGPRDDCPDHPVYPDLPAWKFQSGSRWWVKEIDSMPYSSMMDYELRNGDNTIIHCIQANDLLRFINGDVLRIVRHSN